MLYKQMEINGKCSNFQKMGIIKSQDIITLKIIIWIKFIMTLKCKGLFQVYLYKKGLIRYSLDMNIEKEAHLKRIYELIDERKYLTEKEDNKP